MSIQVAHGDALKLFEELGSTQATKWDAKKMGVMLKNLPDKLAGANGKLDLSKPSKKILDEVTDAVEKKTKIEVIAPQIEGIDDDSPKRKAGKNKPAKAAKETKVKGTKGTKGAKASKNGKATKSSKPKREASEADKWGCRGEGTKAINAAIGDKAVTIDQIAKKAGDDVKRSAIHSHLATLVRKGFVKKLKDGTFRSAKAAK